ncbi:MAG: hypothetical protein Q4C54_02815 [Clostridia bacterium]|nr:hypothetical protein [Clostridia bacterium]
MRFQDEQGIAEAVETIVREALQDRDALERPTQMVLCKEPETKPVAATVTKQPVIAAASVKPTVPTITPTASVPVASKPTEQQNAVAPAVKMTVQPAVTVTAAKTAIPSAAVPETEPLKPAAVTDNPAAAAKQETETEQVRPFAPIAYASSVVKNTSDAVAQYMASTVLPETSGWAKKEMPAVQTEQLSSLTEEQKKPLRLIGTVFNTFILVEYEEHLLMIDQHAVHERLLFDRFSKEIDQNQAGQQLLIPIIMQVSRREQQLLEANKDMLSKVGLNIEPFGENEVSVRSIPMILGQPQTEAFVREMIDQLQSERGTVTMEKRRASILQLACKKAVKGGDRLTEDEIRDLVTRMIDEKVTPTCPHGRPLVISLSHSEIDKRFRRIQ